jgi:single-strand DNA-binding protein
MTVNICHFLGNLTRDPEVRTTGGGKKVVAFGLALNDRRKDQTTGQWVNEPTFVDVEAWEKKGELIAEHFQKGSAIFVTARVKQDAWEDKSTGHKRTKLKFVLVDFQFLPGGRQQEGDPGAYAGGAPDKGGRKPAPPPAADAGDDEEIPF